MSGPYKENKSMIKNLEDTRTIFTCINISDHSLLWWVSFIFFDKINVNQTSSVRKSGSMPFEVFAADDCVRYQRSGSCVPSDNGLLSESTQVILSIHLYNGVNSVIVCISKPAKRNWISLHIEAAESNTLRPEQIVTNQTCIHKKFEECCSLGLSCY